MPNIAVLSDIHGNYVSLQKCLDYALGIGADTFIFLGDYVGELAYPQKTMDLLYSIKETCRCFFVKGNKEDYWTDYGKGQAGWEECNWPDIPEECWEMAVSNPIAKQISDGLGSVIVKPKEEL